MELHERLSVPESPADQFALPFSEMKNRIHFSLIEELGRALFSSELDREMLRDRVRHEVQRRLDLESGISREDRERVVNELTDDILGHGPLERLLADDTVTEIMVNGAADV